MTTFVFYVVLVSWPGAEGHVEAPARYATLAWCKAAGYQNAALLGNGVKWKCVKREVKK